MDPALLREREAFKKRALATPAVEKRKPKPDDFTSRKPAKKAKPSGTFSAISSNKPKKSSSFDYKTAPGTSQYKFSVLAKIINYMKTRHQQGFTHPLSLEEILDETKQLTVTTATKNWLGTEALPNNHKIQTLPDGRFVFKPKYNLKDKKALLRLLDKHDQNGLGGILLEDVQEGLPKSEKAIKALGDRVLTITRPIDKKKVLFYNDKDCQLTVDEEIQKLWRSVAVDSMDEKKIEEYLNRQGISFVQDTGKKIAPVQKRKKVGNRKRKFKTLNDHMGNVLVDYTSQGASELGGIKTS
ncbi:PREDICTED: general transcription factor IIE subunit 2-like [Branchiostoma belcheri]|uniref:Transcription initiation factor IIE subunit beta n=1 Tax=Branchiostoma belcheri TaxID=7741 RepID=A0A6P4YWE0_BRABE|nr:PREDICTED: general transcription factor IIE subunit 2-like [Branchiostoma belcheri]KAI8504028.1 Transcription initiation factor IIE subunit beta [Branchiostoma belcheri]